METQAHLTARIDRERDFHNHRFTHEETRTAQGKYYWAVEHARDWYIASVHEKSPSADIFEIGCATGENIFANSASFRSAGGVDISEVAIEAGNARAKEAGRPNVRLIVGNAESMDLPDASLDLIYGSGIIHHLNIGNIADEVFRLLRGGGKAVFWEPLGHNPIINLYRIVTPKARSPDERPLRYSDVDRLSRDFAGTKLQFFGLTTLALVPFRDMPGARRLRAAAIGLDSLLLKVPGLRWLGWFVVIEVTKGPAPASGAAC